MNILIKMLLTLSPSQAVSCILVLCNTDERFTALREGVTRYDYNQLVGRRFY